MPWGAPHGCARPGCRGLAEIGQRFCIEHRKPIYRKVDGGRVSRNEKEYALKWQAFSAAYLSRSENKHCVDCGEPATEVYHSIQAKFPPQQEQPGVIYEKNCTAVCSVCREARELYRR